MELWSRYTPGVLNPLHTAEFGIFLVERVCNGLGTLISFILYYFNDSVRSSLLPVLRHACMDLHLHDIITKEISIFISLICSVNRLLFSIGVALLPIRMKSGRVPN